MKTIFILLSTIIIATIIEEITAKYLLVEINHAEGQGKLAKEGEACDYGYCWGASKCWAPKCETGLSCRATEKQCCGTCKKPSDLDLNKEGELCTGFLEDCGVPYGKCEEGLKCCPGDIRPGEASWCYPGTCAKKEIMYQRRIKEECRIDADCSVPPEAEGKFKAFCDATSSQCFLCRPNGNNALMG